MNFSTSSRAFRFGIIGGFILFAILNIWVYVVSGHPHGGQTIGFPLAIYVEQFTGPIDFRNVEASHFEWFYPEHIPADILLIFFSSLGIGLLTEVVANSLKRRKAGNRLI